MIRKLLTAYHLLLILLILFSVHCFPLTAVTPGSFFAEGNKNKRAVALTFDDGPGEWTLQVLDILDQYQIKATFFMNGDQVEIRPQLAKEVAKKGHEIADHTYSHINFYEYEKKHGLEKTKVKIKEEIKKSKEIISRITGVSPRLCRMPHGYHRPWMKEIAKEFGVVLVNWTFGQDWHPVSEEEMTKNYSRHLRAGAIFLFHDGGKKREKTVRSLPKIIEEAKKKGVSFLTVGELIQ